MKRPNVLIVLAAAAVLLATPSLSRGQEEGVPARSNPFRVVRNLSAGALSTHSPADLSPANLQRRGIHSPLVNDSISRTSAWQQQQHYWRQFGVTWDDTTDSNVDPLRSRFTVRSINTATIDQRAGRTYRVQENGVDPASLNVRFGRTAGTTEGTQAVSRYGLGRIRRQ